MAGIKDVAHAAGVSVSTVSYVLSGKRAISEKTAAKVRDAIRELQYTPDASAQKMRGIRNRILAVSEPIRGDINEAKYNAYFLHTARQARNAGYDVLLLSGEDAVDDIRRVTRSNMVDGVLLLDIVEDDERVAEAARTASPAWPSAIRAARETARAWTSTSPPPPTSRCATCMAKGTATSSCCATTSATTNASPAMC